MLSNVNGGVAIKLGLDHGQDFRLGKDRAYAKAFFKRLKPEHGWFAWPCTPFCAWMKLAVLRNCDVAPRLKEGRVHLRFSLQLAEHQLTNRRHAHCENPLTPTTWREPQATQTWLRARLDQCATAPGWWDPRRPTPQAYPDPHHFTGRGGRFVSTLPYGSPS